MQAKISSVGAILVSTLIFLAGNGLLSTLIPVRGHWEGFSVLVIGLIGSAYNIGFVVGCFAAPRLLARVGHVRVFAVGAGLAAAMALIQAILVNPPVWLVARTAYGFAAAAMFMVLESWLNDRADNATRGRIFSAYMTVNFGGILCGQILYATSPPGGFELFSLAAICCALCLIPVGLTALPQPKRMPAPTLKPLKLYRISPVGVMGCIAVGLANGAVWALVPLYALDRGLSNGLLALFMVAFTIGGSAIQVPVGKLSDRMDRRYVIAVVCALAGAAGIGMALLHAGGLWLLAAIGVYGTLMLPLYGLSVAHANDRIPREAFVEASATLLMINALASTLGPTLAAGVMDAFGASTLFFFTAAVHLSMMAFTLVRLGLVRAPAALYRDPFKPLPHQASPSALQLDPRRRGEK